MRKWVKEWIAGKNTHYRRVVEDVRAFRYGHENEPNWYYAAIKGGLIEEISKLPEGKLAIHNKGNIIFAWPGDWIISPDFKQFFPMHHDEFIDIFEPSLELSQQAT